jgi:hypothetical protein
MRLALDEKVSALQSAFDAANIPHAFGGAIALAYYATPRGTQDVDVNVFLPASEFDRVLAVLLELAVEPPTPAMRRALARDEQIRLDWDGTPLDLFFSYAALHDACLERRREVAFAEGRIAILSPEDLAVFKVLFSRDKDWRDLGELLLAQGESFDAEYTAGWLAAILEAGDERLGRFQALADRS